jgi:hypothetical protein
MQYINPRNGFLLSMLMIAVGIGCSNLLMSWGEIGLVISFLWDGKYKEKFNRIIAHKRILALSGLYLIFVVGLLHTSNFSSAFNDLRLKLPLLVVPFFAFAFFPLTGKEYKLIFHFIFLGGLITMVTGLLMHWRLVPIKVVDMRSYSPFIAHLRLGTLLVFCIFLCTYLVLKKEFRYVHSIFYVLYAILCLGFLLLLQSLTGFAALMGSLLVVSVYGVTKKQLRKWSLVALLLFALVGGGFAIIVNKEYHRVYDIEKVDFANLPKFTDHGGIYEHYPERRETVNGHYIYINICYWEMVGAWEKRSSMPIHSNNKQNWPIYETLLTYLSSKGEMKNGTTVNALSDKEIKAIENGYGNFLQLNPLDIRFRINQVWWEIETYQRTGDPNSKSFATRLETWKVARYKIAQSPLFGYGTGDVHDAMISGYRETNSKLTPNHWKNPHQQYLSILLTMGILGLISFIGMIYFPLIRFSKQHALFIVALTIAAISMLDEDVLETQAGCTQFIFMYVFTYMFSLYKAKEKIS